MNFLLLGLVIFLGVHSLRIVANDWATQTQLQWGELRWKAAYSVLAALGLSLLVFGFGLARQQPVQLWSPPAGMRHLVALLMLVSFVLLAATYIPGNYLKVRLHHPMVLAVKVWALSHLLANGTLAHLVLFGAFLVWSVLDFRSARQRDRATAAPIQAATRGATVLTLVVGTGLWLVMTFWLHGLLIGIRPLG